MLVKGIYRASRVGGLSEPNDTLHLKIYYPARVEGSDFEKQNGVFPVDLHNNEGGLPVIIFIPGINCGSELYRWFAVELIQKIPLVIVTFSLVGETLPGVIGLTTGVDLPSIMPGNYGKSPTTKVLQPILSLLEKENASPNSPLKGGINLNQVILAGHSAGGTMALQNGSHFPQVIGSFCYGGHNAGPSILGYELGKFLPLPPTTPTLIIGGTNDGVISKSAFRYRPKDFDESKATRPWNPVIQTFREALDRHEQDSFLVMLKGANHTVIIYPDDPTVGRGFLDEPNEKAEEIYRDALVRIVTSFLDHHILKHKRTTVPPLNELVQNLGDLVDLFEIK